MSARHRVARLLVPGALALSMGCASGRCDDPARSAERTLQGLDAALWSQTSAEARLLQLSTFAAATRAMERALGDPSWSAIGQGSEAAGLPTAVVVDVDDTTLDNAPYQAWLVREGKVFDRENWRVWVEAREAPAIPGALEFCRRARDLGVEVYYVTNRDAPQEAATRDNLAALGFPLDAPGDALQMRGERPEWRSDKSGRYQAIGRTVRVLVLVGDDLNDFVAGARGATLAERRELVERHADRFGRDWFLLPNPMYGSWLRSAVDDDPSDEALPEVQRRLRRLEAFEPDASGSGGNSRP